MNNAVETLFSLKAQGTAIPAYLLDHVAQSLAKHEELLKSQIAKTTNAAMKSGLTGSLILVDALETKVTTLK